MKTMQRLAIGVAASFTLAGPVAAEQIDPATPEGYVQIQRKIQCSLEDESPQVYRWSGRGYARVPGEADRQIHHPTAASTSLCLFNL